MRWLRWAVALAVGFREFLRLSSLGVPIKGGEPSWGSWEVKGGGGWADGGVGEEERSDRREWVRPRTEGGLELWSLW